MKRIGIALMIIAAMAVVIVAGFYVGNKALIQNEIDQNSKIESLKDQLRECNAPSTTTNSTTGKTTDLTAIQRAFQRCFNDFNPSGQAKTCINYMRFKECINTTMGRFK